MPIKRSLRHLFKPIDPSAIAFFRILFGAVLMFHLWEQFWFLPAKYIIPEFHFSYPYLAFIQPLSAKWMYINYMIMGLAALFIMLGLFYRFSITVFFLLYSYTFFIDTTFYKNHFYLLILISFLMIFVNADAKYSLTNKRICKPTYLWNIFILRFQFCIVYFFAGISKMNTDWFRGEPLRGLLVKKIRNEGPEFINLLANQEWFIIFASYGGLIFDILIAFFLLNRKTRIPAAFLVIFFHLFNHVLFFNIKPFTYLMLASLILFFNPDWPIKILSKFKRQAPIKTDSLMNIPAPSMRSQKLIVYCLMIYCLIQLALPLRQHLYSGNKLWTSQGERFAWRMILKRERSTLDIYLTDPRTNKTYTINPFKTYLSRRQYQIMATRPEMLLQFAHFLRDKAIKEGIANPIIHMDNHHGINGRPLQQKILSTTNLSLIKKTDPYTSWLLPFDKDWPVSE